MGKKSARNLWNPHQYQLFKKERNEPFYDLLDLIEGRKGMRVVDLGCGSGQLTKILHQTFRAKYTLGIDQSLDMLQEAKKIKEPHLEFQHAEVNSFLSSKHEQPFDLIFSNACLQWLPNHPRLFFKIREHLSPYGQMAIQVPSNYDYPTHVIARKLAEELPFKEMINKNLVRSVLKPEKYATLLHELGFKRQCVKLQIYGHVLESTESVIEWVKGSLLTYYQGSLSPSLYSDFFRIYRERVLEALGNVKPFFVPFKRVLIYGAMSG